MPRDLCSGDTAQWERDPAIRVGALVRWGVASYRVGMCLWQAAQGQEGGDAAHMSEGPRLRSCQG